MTLPALINGQVAEVELPQAEVARLFRGELAGLMRELKADIHLEAARLNSPYRDRQGAAGYMQCSVAYIDQLMAEGRVTKKFIGSKPLIPVADLEKVIAEDSKEPNQRVSPRIFKQPNVA